MGRKRKKYLSFPTFKKAVRALGISSVEEFKQRYEEIPGAPSSPNVTYAGKGWEGHADLFGKKPYQHTGEHRGGKSSPEYRTWHAMMARCFCVKSPTYQYYGAQGVTVCERWKVFTTFLADLGRKPTQQHSLGRAGDIGNYELTNARWMSREEQAAAKREKYATRGYITKNNPAGSLRPSPVPRPDTVLLSVGKIFNGYQILALAGTNHFGQTLARARNIQTGVEFVQVLSAIKRAKSRSLGRRLCLWEQRKQLPIAA
jgi:hypothetical protein